MRPSELHTKAASYNIYVCISWALATILYISLSRPKLMAIIRLKLENTDRTQGIYIERIE